MREGEAHEKAGERAEGAYAVWRGRFSRIRAVAALALMAVLCMAVTLIERKRD